MDRELPRFDPARVTPDVGRRAPEPSKVIAAGLLFTATIVFAQTVSQLIDFRLFDLRLRTIDSNHHASVFGAASLLAQACAAAAIALRVASTPRRLRWLTVAGLVGILLIVRTFVRPQMTILLLPVAVVFVSLCWLTLQEPASVRPLVWGSLFLLACSFALHTAGPETGGTAAEHQRDRTWTYQVTGMLKHGAELSGWMLLATGMAVTAHRPTVAGTRRRQPD